MQDELFLGRNAELRRLREALQKRQSLLIWGPAEAGKTALVRKLLDTLPEAERDKCWHWSGPSGGRELAAGLVRHLFVAGDPIIHKKVAAESGQGGMPDRWLRRQSIIRLRSVLFNAASKARYAIFLDHMPPATHAMARLVKEIIWRGKTPVCWIARGCAPTEIGHAWSTYFAPEYRLRVGPLPEPSARRLLELSIERFGLAAMDLRDFREEALRLSGLLPGAIVKLCELAADPRYHYGQRIKLKLVHVDYLMRANTPDIRRPTDIQT